MAILVGSNFSVSTNLHIDDRAVVATLEARNEIPVGRRYLGMQVFVEENSTNYQLIGGLEDDNFIKISDANGSYVHPTGDGNLHVPATGTTNNGKVLMAGETPGSIKWSAIPIASTSVAGIVELTSDLDSTLETKAATALAVKTVNDKVVALQDDVVTTATANKILKLDADAKLAANVAGNADTSSKLQTARTIALEGDATGSVTFDGSENASIETTLKDSGVVAGKYNNITVDEKGRVIEAEDLTIESLNSVSMNIGSEEPTNNETVWFQID